MKVIRQRVEEPRVNPSIMDVVQCEGCRRAIDVRALRPSHGGFDVYCTICGHISHIDP